MTKIIAELCQNHSGQREILGKAIKAAAEAGADYVKSQLIFSEDLAFRERFEEGDKAIKRPYKPELERLQKLDLTEDDHKWFVEEAKRNNVIPMTTVFARKRIPLAASIPWSERVVKVASYDCASWRLLRELCDSFDHLIISTGATLDDEIAKAVEVVKNRGKKLTFLHCVTSYPNTLEMCNLARMDFLHKFTDSVGWSDHTLVERDGLKAAKVAIMLGADYVERHFTVLGKDETKDGPVSINPAQLKELVEFAKLPKEEQKRQVEADIPDWQIILGQETRELTETELLNRDYYRGRFGINW